MYVKMASRRSGSTVQTHEKKNGNCVVLANHSSEEKDGTCRNRNTAIVIPQCIPVPSPFQPVTTLQSLGRTFFTLSLGIFPAQLLQFLNKCPNIRHRYPVHQPCPIFSLARDNPLVSGRNIRHIITQHISGIAAIVPKQMPKYTPSLSRTLALSHILSCP